MTTLAFDVYGTLIDTAGVTDSLETMIGEDAAAFSNLWRTKQLEYTWRYGLMGIYQNFRVCTEQALNLCCLQTGHDLSTVQRKQMMEKYLALPPFDDVADGLTRLREAGVSMYAFSNGMPTDLETLLTNAEIRDLLDGVVSVDDKQTFKPNPLLYHYFAERAGEPITDCWLISSNGFDVCGSIAAGMPAVWLQRNRAVPFDPWETQPTKLVHSFDEMTKLFI